MQPCRHCKIMKPLTDFYRHPGFKTTGRNTICKECAKAVARRNEKKNRKTNNERKKRYRSQPHVKAQRAAYYRAHRAKQRPEYFVHERETCKAWLKQSGMSPVYNNRRRSRLMAVNEDYSKEDRAVTMTLFGRHCFKCGSQEDLQIDHHCPLSAGFALESDNGVVLCRSCNSSKCDQMPEDFYSEQELDAVEWILAVGGPF